MCEGAGVLSLSLYYPCRGVHIPFPIHREPGVDMARGLPRVRPKRRTDMKQLEATERPAPQS